MLRIFDVLITNLVEDSRSLQFEKGIKLLACNPDSPLKVLEEKIRKCGVAFHLWEKKDANGRGSGTPD